MNKSFDIKILTTNDTLSIQNIWRECFTQDTNYINNFIEFCFPYTTSFGLFQNTTNELVAMLSLLPSYSIIANKPESMYKLNGAYVYGVGTLINHRGNGYSQLLMEQVFKYSSVNSLDYILVKPAEESLFDLYKRQSFDKTIWSYNIEVDIEITHKNTDQGFSEKNNTPNFNESHLILRESIGTTNFLWPKEILNYSLLEIESRDGITHYNDETSLFYSAYPIEGDAQAIKVIDHNVKTENRLEILINHLASKFPLAKKATIEFPITTAMTIFSQARSRPIKTKNALIKILNPNKDIEEKLLKMHLTLAME